MHYWFQIKEKLNRILKIRVRGTNALNSLSTVIYATTIKHKVAQPADSQMFALLPGSAVTFITQPCSSPTHTLALSRSLSIYLSASPLLSITHSRITTRRPFSMKTSTNPYLSFARSLARSLIHSFVRPLARSLRSR